MLKKISCIIMILLFLPINQEVSANDDMIPITIPRFNIVVNGEPIDNLHSKYPVIFYKDITYFPMTYNYTKALGLITNWDSSTGISINSAIQSKLDNLIMDVGESNSLETTYYATLPEFSVKVNGKTIDNSNEEFPLIIFRDVVYFPMTYRFANTVFGFQTSFNAITGFSISNKNFKPKTQPIILSISNDRSKMVVTNNTNDNISSIKVIHLFYNKRTYNIETKSSGFSFFGLLKPKSQSEESIYSNASDYQDSIYLGSTVEFYYVSKKDGYDRKDFYTKYPNYDFEINQITSQLAVSNAYAYSEQALKERMIQEKNAKEQFLANLQSELQDNNYMPIKFVETNVTYNSIGSPIANLTIKNLSNKTIDAYEVSIKCFDSYGRLVKENISGNSVFLGISQNNNLNTGESQTDRWTMYLFDNTTNITPTITSIHFTDGTTWRR